MANVTDEFHIVGFQSYVLFFFLGSLQEEKGNCEPSSGIL